MNRTRILCLLELMSELYNVKREKSNKNILKRKDKNPKQI